MGDHDGCACLVAIRSGTSILFRPSFIHSSIDWDTHVSLIGVLVDWLYRNRTLKLIVPSFPVGGIQSVLAGKKTSPNGVTVRVPQMDYYYTVVLTLKGHII